MIVKPGYKTTEALAFVLAAASSWLANWQGSLSPKWAALATTLSAIGYMLSRAITKHGVATGSRAVVPVVATEAVTPAAPAAPVGAPPQQV